MRILHLEDDRADAELVRALLTAEWPECRITLVASKPAFVAELARGGYDLILSDFALPQFDGLEALEIARRQSGETPFIFLSGNIGEDRAIEAVRAGAQDYVLKERTKRLITAIPRALEDSRGRQRMRATESERHRLAATLESSPDIVGLSTPEGRMLYLNRAGRDLLGLPSGASLDNLSVEALHPPEVNRQWRESFAAAIRDGAWSGENLLQAGDGRVIPVSQVIVAHAPADGTSGFLSTVMRDLSEWKRAQALVDGQNQVLEMIAGGEPVDDTLMSLLRFIEQQSDDLYCSILLANEDGRTLRPGPAPRIPAEYTATVGPVRVGPDVGTCGTAAHLRSVVVTADIATDPRWADYRAAALAHGLRACWSAPIFDETHRLLGTLAVYRRQPGEPGERHRHLMAVAVHIAAICLSRSAAERRLRDQADILDKAGDAIIATDAAGRITLWNHGAEHTFGWSAAEALGRTEAQLFAAATRPESESARRAGEQGQEWRGELRLADRGGKIHMMETRITMLRDAAGQPQGRLSIATDVTARRSIEEQFFRAQRLESIGMLAAGIAHDLNNVLAPILLGAPMLRDRASDPGDLRIISTLEKSAERGAALVRQILGFAHGADGEHSVLQPKHLLRDIAAFIEETFPKSISLEHHIAADLWPVKGNPTQLHQVLLNLSVNARDAMPAGGTFTLRGENVVLDESAAADIENGRPGAFVVFHVQDTGSGIAPDVLARIWEPFYTTKPSGKGTGLGLSTVRGIVESHGGFATVHTLVGRGTTFRVHFPAAEISATGTGDPAPVSAVSRGAGELVLVVDDEPGVRNLAAAILARHGYRVLTAADGAEAIALFAPRSKDIRVVITDLSMPNLDGAALAGVVQRINPAVKVIAVSGHQGGPGATAPAGPAFAQAFLLKPFRPEALLTMVHELLRAPPNPPP